MSDLIMSNEAVEALIDEQLGSCKTKEVDKTKLVEIIHHLLTVKPRNYKRIGSRIDELIAICNAEDMANRGFILADNHRSCLGLSKNILKRIEDKRYENY